MSFHFRVFNYAKAVSNGRLKNIYPYTIRLQNDIQNTISEINSFVHKISHVQTKLYAYDGVCTHTPQLSL